MTHFDPSGIHSVANLLWHLPTGMVDRRQVRRVADLAEGEIATVLLKVGGTVVFYLEAFFFCIWKPVFFCGGSLPRCWRLVRVFYFGGMFVFCEGAGFEVPFLVPHPFLSVCVYVSLSLPLT